MNNHEYMTNLNDRDQVISYAVMTTLNTPQRQKTAICISKYD